MSASNGIRNDFEPKCLWSKCFWTNRISLQIEYSCSSRRGEGAVLRATGRLRGCGFERRYFDLKFTLECACQRLSSGFEWGEFGGKVCGTWFPATVRSRGLPASSPTFVREKPMRSLSGHTQPSCTGQCGGIHGSPITHDPVHSDKGMKNK